jgi:hypothetical protein
VRQWFAVPACVLLIARIASAQTTGSISGTVTLFETAFETRPSIQVLNASGVLVNTVSLGQTPDVMTPSTDTIPWTATGLAPGTYYVRTSNPIIPSGLHVAPNGPWVDTLFDKIPCVAADCNPLTGTPVNVVAGQTTSGIDFTLHVGASISGAGNVSSLSSVQSFDIFDSRGVLLPNRIAPDVFRLTYRADALPAGTYYLLGHRAADGSAPETLYQNVPCDGCAVTSGTPVTVAFGESKTGIDFGRPAFGGISGTVQSDGSANPPNAPLSGVTVAVYASNGTALTGATTASDGTYSIAALAPGTYYVATRNQAGYVDGIYAGIACGGCDPTTGTPVTVTATTTTAGIDFSLAQGTAVSGHDLETLATFPALTQGTVVFYTSSPATPIARSGMNLFSGFTVTLPQGSYFVQTNPLSGFVQQIYPGVPCPQGNCPTMQATPVTVADTAVTGIDFKPPACAAPTIAPLTLAQAAVGAAYRQTLLATGATGAVGFTVSSGTLPPGLSLDPNTGVLSGTPTVSGRFTFTVAAIDATGCAGARTYLLDVPPCPFTLFTPSASLRARGEPWLILLGNTCGTVTATSNASWITVQTVTSTAVGVVAAPNTGGPRQGTVTIGPRVFTIFQSGAVSSPPFGFVDTPADGAVVAGSVAISGWALDDLGVTRVFVFRDPVEGEPSQPIFVGQATFVPGARPDVEAAFPALPFKNRAGWGYLVLTNMLPNHGNGTFRFLVIAEDADLTQTLIGTKIINAVNDSATAPFGAIDTPDQGATISGPAFINFGWALTPQPKLIPFDGSTIHVILDGVDVGPVTAYNFFRSDVSNAFPGLKNSGGPVGYRILDTTALSEGLHTIAWTVTDDGGITTGIGSRFFAVSNSAWQPSLRANFAAAPPAFSASEAAQADATTAVPPRVDGVDLGRQAASLAALPVDADGAGTVRMSSLQRLQLSLDAAADTCPSTYAGYLVVNGELRPLPIGSSLDPAGTFYWQPGPGYFGTYRLLFVRTSCVGTQQRIPVSVLIQ